MTNLTHSSFLCIYFNSLHDSSNPVLIIRRINCYQYNLWYMSLCIGDCFVCRSERNCSFLTCTRNGHRHRVTYTRWCTGTIDSFDDQHGVARNMYRIEINTQKRTVHQVGHLPWIITRCTVNKIYKNDCMVYAALYLCNFSLWSIDIPRQWLRSGLNMEEANCRQRGIIPQ